MVRGQVDCWHVVTDIFAETRAKVAAREALATGPAAPFRVPIRAGHVLVHRSTQTRGTWQCTAFVGPEPVGHIEGDWPTAVRAAHAYGADLRSVLA
jgi:hypothetical protein